MPVDEKNEGAGAESHAEGAGGQEPEGATQSPTLPEGDDTVRIGTKDDIRGGGGKYTPRNTLRDGTR